MSYEGDALRRIEEIERAGAAKLEKIRGDIRGVIGELDRLMEDLRRVDPPDQPRQ